MRLSHLLSILISLSVISACTVEREVQTSVPTPEVKRISHEDFWRADQFLLGLETKAVLNREIAYQWLDDGLWYRFADAAGHRWLRVDGRTGEKTDLFDHGAMAAAMGTTLGQELDAAMLPIDRLTRMDDANYLVVSGIDALNCDLAAASCEKVQTPEGGEATAVASPDGLRSVFRRDDNLWLLDNVTGEKRQLTRDGKQYHSYGKTPESSTSEITVRRYGVDLPTVAIWSPDGSKFLSYQLDERHVPQMPLVQHIPEDGAWRPLLHEYKLPLLGEKPPFATLFIFDLDRNQRIDLDHRAFNGTMMVMIARGDAFWSEDGDSLYLLDAPGNEGFMSLSKYDTSTGEGVELLREEGGPMLFAAPLFSELPNVRVLSNGEFIWHSERSGWGHLYLYDAEGELKNAITSGEWLARSIVRVDEDAGVVWISGTGREGGDIYDQKLYRVALDGSSVKLITPEAGDHLLYPERHSGVLTANMLLQPPPAPVFSPAGDLFVDRVAADGSLGSWTLRQVDGEIVTELARDDYSQLPPLGMPERFTVKSADGNYTLYGTLILPPDFDPAKQYPVVEYIYPGPQVTVRLLGGMMGMGNDTLGQLQALAQLGFVVYMIDGRGTPLRSREFLLHAWGNMDKAGNLEDHISGLKQLAKTRPWLDLERVGIWGSSAGGLAAAHALLDYPDFYKVGVSSAGVHENRAYINLWGEIFHDKPDQVDEKGNSTYEKVFPGVNAHQLKGKLLIAHGEMDENVHPAMTYRLVDSLTKAGKRFDMLMMPNINHRIGDDKYFQRVTQNYFLEHLMGAELPSQSDLVVPGST